MTDPSKEKVSPDTKLIVKKVHAGRKQDSKFWRSAFEPSEKNTSKKQPNKPRNNPSVFLQIMALLLGLAIGLIIVTVKYGPENMPLFYDAVASDVKSIFMKNDAKVEIKPKPISYKNPNSGIQRENKQYSDQQIRNVVEKVLYEKEQNERHKTQTAKFEYIIELDSGVEIRTDNVKIVGDKVTYAWENGLVVSINKDSIKSLKRVQVFGGK